jgi:protocatechuate 3,4-dioxygenase beta subunit
MEFGIRSVLIFAAFVLASCTQADISNTEIRGTEITPVVTDSGIDLPTQTPKPKIVPTGMTTSSEQGQSKTIPEAKPDPILIPCSGELTSTNQEGPFYKTGSPERESLIDEGLAGTPIIIIGRVFDQDCNTLSDIKLDFWLANADGEYDNAGYTLRGYQLTDENGYYSIESIEPTPYTGRPSHIHVKLFAPDGRELLTTQMYFPGSESSADVLNSPDLLATYLAPDSNGRQRVLFNFVLQD